MSNEIDKIKKLLALAAGNSGATEAEAASAMEMASALMTKYSIEQHDLLDRPNILLKKVQVEGAEDNWHGWLMTASGKLMAVRAVNYGNGTVGFIGPEHSVFAACEMFPWLVSQVESLYKRDLPRGMSKAARANFRRTFKQACSARVYHRAEDILTAMMTEGTPQQRAIGSTALVVRNTVAQQLEEIAGFMQEQGFQVRRTKSKAIKGGLGTGAGARVGDQVQINRQLGAGPRLAITHRR